MLTTESPTNYGGPDRPFRPIPRSALDGSIVACFDDAARRFSERLAIRDAVRQLTYAELAVVVDRIAGATARAVSDREGPVALLLAGDAFFPAAMLGALTCGRGYVPLDPRWPIARNHQIAVQAGAAAVICAGDLADRLRKELPQEIAVVNIDALGDVAGPSRRQPAPGDLAYVIYTSGSTGAPKGVYQSHRNLLYYVMQATEMLHVNHDDRLTFARLPSTIGASHDVLLALLNGASLHMLPPHQLQPAGLIREIRSRNITIYRSSPTLLRRICEALSPGQRLDSVRLVQLVSERMDWADFDIFRRIFPPDAFLMVGLGSTECPMVRWFVDESVRASSPRLPVGRALPDRTVSIVDEDGHPAAAGEVGEFMVACRYAALGYWRDPDATARAFKTDAADPEIRIFKTGDLGLRRPDGLFEFAGRKDQQVKLRGHRIEPAEIEATLRGCADVRDAAVLVRKNEAGVPRSLVAYVEARPGARDLTPGRLTSMLAERLPHYMVPATFILCDELRRLPGLKIDRVQLARIDANRKDRALDPIENPLVHEVAEIFKLVLHAGGITLEDNVASLGGDSLQAVKVAVELEKRFGIVISHELFESKQTIGALADWIASQTAQRPSQITGSLHQRS